MLAFAMTFSSSCSSEREEHTSKGGPLSAETKAGVTSVDAPEKMPWTATFGSFLLCSTTGTKITLEEVRYETLVEPFNISVVMREAPPGSSPVSSASGPPSSLDGGEGLAGEIEEFKKGWIIDQRCDVNAGGFTELLFVVESGKFGGHIRQAWLDYEAGGNPYTLKIDWQMITCGTKVEPVDGLDRCEIKAVP
ncbi:hypothetical protein [Streptomyces sp. GSL17-111]|uniref:hypothetical protein n=1 Tax=Streptomyces sp. GSL17-111 TaxID=3121596 RepID=UPI0030F425E5